MSNTIRIMLIEDHKGYRETIEVALEQEPEMELVGSFGSSEFALKSLQEAKTPAPDVILLDLNLPRMSGLDAIRWIHEYAPQVEIIILTQSSKTTEVQKAIEEGASGYLLKSSTVSQIMDGIRIVTEGGASLDPEVARYLLNTLKKKTTVAPAGKALSERELSILNLLADGLAQKEIATDLGISVTTVVYHIQHIYEKLEVGNAPAAISKAYKSGILNPE